MRRLYFTKRADASGAVGGPLWIRVPGTPFTLPGSPTMYERLPGMTEWVPRKDVEAVSRALKADVPIEEISAQEAERGFAPKLLKGLGFGVTGGALGGRLIGGEPSIEAFKKIKDIGLTKDTLKGLGKVPTVMKVAPLVGAGLGALGAYSDWKNDYMGRANRARDIAKGLLAENILQTSAISDAQRSLRDYGEY